MYTSPCNDCQREYNIGQTKRRFGVRLKEHERAIFLCIKIVKLCRNMPVRPTIKLGEICHSNVITAIWRYYERLSLQSCHINSAHAPSKHDHGGFFKFYPTPIYTLLIRGDAH